MLVLRTPCFGVWYPQGVRVPPVKNHWFKSIGHSKKNWFPLRKLFAPLVPQAGYGPSLPGCALRNCVVARFLLYGRRDEVHAPLASLFLEKTVK